MTHYNTLNVSNDASQSEIKKQYKLHAQRSHPDRGGDEAAFMQIQRAYDTLGDPDKREYYDKTGKDDQPDPIAEAESRLMQLFHELIIKDEFGGDMIKAAVNAVINSISDMQSKIGTNDSKIRSIDKRKGRVRRNGDGPNLYVRVAETKISELKQLNKDLAYEIELINKLLVMLKDYTDDGVGVVPTFQTGGV